MALRRIAKGSFVATLVCGSASAGYVYSDPGRQRSFAFWRSMGPVVGSYVYSHLLHKYWYKSDGEKRKQVFAELNEINAPIVYGIAVDLRGILIKACQYLSVRPEITPEPYRRAFKVLQTDAPSEPLSVVVRVIERELGKPIADLFEEIEPSPCGSASTAQAHVARLKDSGERVVVKVQYPDAEKLFKSDISNLSQLARLLQYFDNSDGGDEGVNNSDGGQDVDTNAALEASLTEFKKQFLAEFDYEREVTDMQEIGKALRSHSVFRESVTVPEPIEGMCTRRLITMTYLPGPTLESKASRLLQSVGIDLKEGVKAIIKEEGEEPSGRNRINTDNIDRSLYSRITTGVVRFIGPSNALRAWRCAEYLKRDVFERFAVWVLLDVFNYGSGHWHDWAMSKRIEMVEVAALSHVGAWVSTLTKVHGYEIFKLGVFNGDPHPGNILCLDDGRLGLIDYGQCKRLKSESQKKLAKLICCVADNSDDKVVADAFRDVGLITKNDDTFFIAAFARLLLGPLLSQHLEHDWHMKLHKSDRVITFPPDIIIFLRVAGLLRGLSLVLKQNMSVADQWREYASAALLVPR